MVAIMHSGIGQSSGRLWAEGLGAAGFQPASPQPFPGSRTKTHSGILLRKQYGEQSCGKA